MGLEVPNPKSRYQLSHNPLKVSMRGTCLSLHLLGTLGISKRLVHLPRIYVLLLLRTHWFSILPQIQADLH